MSVGSGGRVDGEGCLPHMLRRSQVAEQSPRDLPFTPLSSPSQRTNKWRLDVEMTKRWTECTGREGSRIALQMRWGNVAVVRWAAE